jgi:GntR family transcriptional regulator
MTRRPVRRTGRAPLWEQVLSDLRARLDRGEFAEGFPSDRELTTTYRVSRHTAREAVRHLQREGAISRQRGRGSWVRPLSLEQAVGPLYSLFRSIEAQGHEQRSDVLGAGVVRDARVAARLGLRGDAALWHLRRLRRADGTPFAVDDIWLPERVARPLRDVDFTHTAVYAELERLAGVRPVRGWERIRPGLPTPEQRRLLGVGARAPVFVIQRSTEHARGPLEWRVTVVRGDAWTFTATWSGGSADSGFAPEGAVRASRGRPARRRP